MIIDYQKDPWTARLFSVIDAETGEVIEEPYFWASDRLGCYRVYPRSETGAFYLGHDGTLPFIERIRDIKIIPRAGLHPERLKIAEGIMNGSIKAGSPT